MSNAILILGESGTGKSYSMLNLKPEETFIIGVANKSLPFRGWRDKYKKSNDGTGNYCTTDSPSKIVWIMDGISNSRKDIKNIIIDDFQYTMSNAFMRGTQADNTKSSVFKNYNDIGYGSFIIAEKMNNLRDDIKVFVLCHSHRNNHGFSKIKTVGSLTDEKVTFEGHFTITLHTIIRDELSIEDGRYGFLTNSTGTELSKSPFGMFDDLIIKNDLNYVSNKIDEYEGIIDFQEVTNKEKQKDELDDPWDIAVFVPYEKNNQAKTGE